MPTTDNEGEHSFFTLQAPMYRTYFQRYQTWEMRKIIKKAVDALNAYFIPKTDTTYARHSFRQLTQTPGETTRQFATRLRRVAKDCGYGEDTENQIRDEILCKCTNTYLKRKLLEEGSGLTLAKTLQIAENCEVDSQLAAMSLEKKGENSESVNRIIGSKNDGKKQKQPRKLRRNRGWSYYRCGSIE